MVSSVCNMGTVRLESWREAGAWTLHLNVHIMGRNTDCGVQQRVRTAG